MDRTPLVKLLLISALSAGLVLPLFFYSRGLLQKAEKALVAAQVPEATPSTSADTTSQDGDASSPSPTHGETGHGPADSAHAKAPENASAETGHSEHAAPTAAQASALPTTSATLTPEVNTKDQTEPDPGAQVYKPPLFGSCKRMFQQLQKQQVAEGEYKAFAFAFNGKTANCAEYVSNKSLRHARAVVLKNCQEERAEKRYVACQLYDVQ